MEFLKGKKILFIGPKYFGYEDDIRFKIEEYGGRVSYIVENIDYVNVFYSGINKLPSDISEKMFTQYFINKIKSFGNISFDYVFLIRGNLITKDVIEYIKMNNKHAQFLMYQWDAISTVKNILNLTKYFDKVFTFDKKDFEEYRDDKKKWRFRPLFYVDDYKSISRNTNKEDIDILFVGTQHSKRNQFINRVKELSKEHKLNFYSYLYIPRLVYYKRRLFDAEYRGLKASDVRFKSMSRTDLISLISRSKVIIDYQFNQQDGLTIRTIESLGAKKKLITTNKRIEEYDFYLSNNIQIIDKGNIKLDLDKDFIHSKYKEIDEVLYNKYSMEQWIVDIFKN